jgi:carbonic anhydrase/acetyltransferase-like protein (isoleucine patch superfamily)
MGAILLSRTRIGRECLIAAGAVVPPDLVVPDRMLVVGVPGRVARPVGEKDLEYMRWLTGHYIELAERYVVEENVRPQLSARDREFLARMSSGK